MDGMSTPDQRLPGRGLTIAAVWVCALVALVTLGPLVLEVVSAFTGQHVWTVESFVYAVIPIAGIVAAVILLRSARRARSLGGAIGFALVSMAVVIAACTPILVLFWGLLELQFRPAP